MAANGQVNEHPRPVLTLPTLGKRIARHLRNAEERCVHMDGLGFQPPPLPPPFNSPSAKFTASGARNQASSDMAVSLAKQTRRDSNQREREREVTWVKCWAGLVRTQTPEQIKLLAPEDRQTDKTQRKRELENFI